MSKNVFCVSGTFSFLLGLLNQLGISTVDCGSEEMTNGTIVHDFDKVHREGGLAVVLAHYLDDPNDLNDQKKAYNSSPYKNLLEMLSEISAILISEPPKLDEEGKHQYPDSIAVFIAVFHLV